jgi:hypothetical protein
VGKFDDLVAVGRSLLRQGEAVSLEERRRWRETDPEFRLKLEDGVWFLYLVEFDHEGSSWGFEVWARDLDDAKRRLASLQINARVLGQKMAEVV